MTAVGGSERDARHAMWALIDIGRVKLIADGRIALASPAARLRGRQMSSNNHVCPMCEMGTPDWDGMWQHFYVAHPDTPLPSMDWLRRHSAHLASLSQRVARLEAALQEYANPSNWTDRHGDGATFARECVWVEPDSETPEAYHGYELAQNALSPADTGDGLGGDK